METIQKKSDSETSESSDAGIYCISEIDRPKQEKPMIHNQLNTNMKREQEHQEGNPDKDFVTRVPDNSESKLKDTTNKENKEEPIFDVISEEK